MHRGGAHGARPAGDVEHVGTGAEADRVEQRRDIVGGGVREQPAVARRGVLPAGMLERAVGVCGSTEAARDVTVVSRGRGRDKMVVDGGQAGEAGAMRWLILPLVGALGAGLHAGTVRAQAPVDAFQVQGWSGGAYVDPRGTFSHCAVTTTYSGVALGFTLTPALDFRIEIASDDWRLTAGTEYVATLVIDYREPLQIIALARTDKMLVAEFGADEDFMRELREGLFLRVLAEKIGLSFSLSGSSQALLKLRSCVNERRGSASTSR